MIIRSKFSGKCKVCGSKIAVGDPCEWTRGERGVKCARCADKSQLQKPEDTSRKLEADGTVRMPFDRESLALLRSAAGARWVPERKVWVWSVEDQDLPRAIEIARALQLEIAPELIARQAEGTAETRAAKARLADLEAAAGVRLYPFQREGVEWLALREKALLGDDMGLGKTVQVLMALPERAACLVVCPASLKINWEKETKKWRPDLTPVVVMGRRSFRTPAAGEVVIVNYDILPPPEAISVLWGDPELPDMILVVDECQFVKNYRTKRSKAVKALRESCWRVQFLTGTPLEARPTDLYGILDVLGERALGGWSRFVSLFNGYKNRFGGYEWGMPQPEVAERLRRCMIRRTKAEVLPDLPKKRRVDLWI